MKPGDVRIPESELQAYLDRAAKLKREAEGLLRELEEGYLGRPVEKLGAWRQDPESFQRSKP
jgi:hypothetical protein